MTPHQIAALIYLVAIGSAGMLALCGMDTWLNTPAPRRTWCGKNYKRERK